MFIDEFKLLFFCIKVEYLRSQNAALLHKLQDVGVEWEEGVYQIAVFFVCVCVSAAVCGAFCLNLDWFWF